MPHRVLHLLGTAQPEGSGIFHFVSGLARGLDPQRYQLEAWFLGEDGPLAKQLADSGVKIRVIPWLRVYDLWGGLRFWWALRRGKFDIIHQHLWGRRVSSIARFASRARHILHLHSNVPESKGVDPVRIPTGSADTVIATSHAVAAWAEGRRRPFVIHPGVCISPSAAGEAGERGNRDARTIGTAGRLVPMKGIIFLIRAMASLRGDYPELRLEIAGTGPERTALEDEAEKLGLADCVTFLGWREDLAAVHARWEAYVQPSVMEPIGLAVLEAMAAGLPVVATEVGGLPEVVDEGRTGWLVPARDPEALVARIRALLRDPERRHAMGEAGRTRAREQFSIERVVAQIVEVYEAVLQTNEKR